MSGDSPTSKDVFVSYASQDAAVADSVVETLETHGIRCWIAPRDVTPGEFYAGVIVHAIDAAKATVLVLSEHAAASPHVVREVERAASKRHPVISVRIDRAPLPADLEYFLNTSQWLDASEGDAKQVFPRLVDAVRKVLAGAPTTGNGNAGAALSPVASMRGSRRRSGRPIAIVLGLVVAIMGFAIDRWWVSRRIAAEKPVAAATPAVPVSTPTIPEKSVAVLPFVDMSEKKDQEYFSDGLSEELIDMLTKISDVHVPARTSSFYFKGKQATIADIAKALGVAHVLEGSVRKSGSNLRITAQLIRVDSGYHVWSETYDRKLDDIFKVQDDIAGAVVQALKVHLLVGNLPVAEDGQHAEAYNLLLQSRFFGRRGAEGDEQRAREYLQRAVALDPGYALAWARLSLNYDPRDPRARKAAQRALELDPLLADAHVSLGNIYEYYDWAWKAADSEYKRALALDPSDEIALAANGDLAMRLGRSQDAVSSFKRAADRDPLSPGAFDGYGDALRVAGRLSEAETAYRRALLLSPQDFWAHVYLGMVLLERGKLDAALAEIRQSNNESFRLWGLTIVYFAMNRKADSDQSLAELTTKYAQQWPSMVAVAYAVRSQPDPAFDWFARAYHQHDPGVTWLKVGPLWRNVRGDPRYAEWLRKLDLPE